MNPRLTNPRDPSERPTFLPGDKVRDKRDFSGKVWRIVARVAHYDDEQITLHRVDGRTERAEKVQEKKWWAVVALMYVGEKELLRCDNCAEAEAEALYAATKWDAEMAVVEVVERRTRVKLQSADSSIGKRIALTLDAML